MLENQRFGFGVGRPHILGISNAASKNSSTGGSWPNRGMASLIARGGSHGPRRTQQGLIYQYITGSQCLPRRW